MTPESHPLLILLRLIIHPRKQNMQINSQINKSKNKWKISHGVTIIELLIYLALLTLFLTVLLDVFVTTLNFKLQSESTSALNQDARYIFERLSYDVYNSDSFAVPSASELDLTFGGNTVKYTVNSGNLVRNYIAP